MNEITYQIIELTEKNINILETIRYNAYNIKKEQFYPEKSFYSQKLNNKNYLVFGCFLNNQLIGACYTSKFHNSLYIEQLFILKKYQKTILHLGSNLLKFVLKNKKQIETYFNTTFYYSYLEDYQDTTKFYESLGYTKQNQYMKKRI